MCLTELIMTVEKESMEVVKFMTLFQRLRGWIDDEPAELERLANDDVSVLHLCNELFGAATFISMNERRRRQLFAAPVDPKFIAAWRDYEERYASPIAGAFLLALGNERQKTEKRPPRDFLWETADEDAKGEAYGIENALDFAEDQATQDWRDFPEGFREGIVDGIATWRRLKEESGFDLRGIFRRRELVPFVLIPRHVSKSHGDAEKLSLLTHLQQAHDAFVFGVPFAALALMRSILEVTLTKHYRAEGEDLNEKIAFCRDLPPGASKWVLHDMRRLANDVLHFNNEQVRLPQDFEKESFDPALCLARAHRGCPDVALVM